MKKLLCYLLIGWLALMSGGANALPTYDAAHEAEHAASVQTASSNSSTSTGNTDTSHTDSCKHSHCGHGHTTGMLMPSGISHSVNAPGALPVAHSCWASAATANNIERPKWPITTPAVVCLWA